MPTLVDVEVSIPQQLNVSDASETILYDESPLLDDSNRDETQETAYQHRETPRESKPTQRHEIHSPRHNPNDVQEQDVTFDESATILSQSLLNDDTLDNSSISMRVETKSSVSPQVAEIRQPRNRPVDDAAHQTRDKPVSNAKAVGPSEIIYHSDYESYVKKSIHDFDRHNPGRLPEYRSMSAEEKAREQERALTLLSRLGIGKGPQRGPSQHIQSHRHASIVMNATPSPNPIDRQRLLDDTMSPILSPGCYQPPQMGDNDSFCMQPSYAQMSQSSTAEKLISPSRPWKNDASVTAGFPDNLSTDSVEIVRAASQESFSSDVRAIYESPDALKGIRANPHKRQASVSAKRGADLARTKYNEDAVSQNIHKKGAGSSKLEITMSHPMERMSLSPTENPKDHFVASQSPISPRLTYDSSDGGSESDEGLGGRISLDGSNNGLVRRSDDTISSYTTDKRKHRAMREIPMNVGLREGATFHLEKLNVKRSQKARIKSAKGGLRRRLVNFPDPLIRYSSRERKVLNRVFELLRRSEEDSHGQTETCSANVLFSLTNEQIVDLCLKQFLKDEETESEGHEKPPIPLQGQTVIVSRTKEDTATWERALREGTGCSVFNHATVPLSERIRMSTAEKATKFNVTLTTYDALKSADIAIPVDEAGRAILSASGKEKGWLSSRTVSQSDSTRRQRCKQLSVLHKINFQRVIFVDLLGRKSFLAKSGTARANASVALRANSRLAFFSRSDADGSSAFITLKKSDRNAIMSLSAILHLRSTDLQEEDRRSDREEEIQDDDPLEACALDLQELL